MTRWAQSEIVQLRDLIAVGKTSSEVADIMGRPQKSVLSVALHHKLGPWKSCPARNTKPDRDSLAERMATSTMAELSDAYQVSAKTVYLWAHQYGLPTKRDLGLTEHQKRQRSERVRKQAVVQQASRAFTRQSFTIQARTEGYQRDMSEAGQAADFMRRDRRVFRCDISGNQSQGGKYWMCGIVWMTDAELIERARAKGFQPVRWAA